MTCEEHLIENAIYLLERNPSISALEFCHTMKKDANYKMCRTSVEDLYWYAEYVLYIYAPHYKSKVVEEMETKYGYKID